MILSVIGYGIWIGIVVSIIVIFTLTLYRKLKLKVIQELPVVISPRGDTMLVEAEVGGKMGYFVIDTGCNINVVNDAFLEGLDESCIRRDPQRLQSSVAYTAGDSRTIHPCLLDFTVNNVLYTGIQVSVADGIVDTGWEKDFNLEYPVIGFLGYTFFREHGWIVNATNHKLYYYV